MRYFIIICLLLSGCAQFHKAQRAEWYEWRAGEIYFDTTYGPNSCKPRVRDLAVEMMIAKENFKQWWGTYKGVPHIWVTDKYGRIVDPSVANTSAELYVFDHYIEYNKMSRIYYN